MVYQTTEDQFLSLLPDWYEGRLALPVIFSGYGYAKAEGPVNLGQANNFFEVSELVRKHDYSASHITRMEVKGRTFYIAHNGVV